MHNHKHLESRIQEISKEDDFPETELTFELLAFKITLCFKKENFHNLSMWMNIYKKTAL